MKSCLECYTENATDALTCVACGGGSWPAEADDPEKWTPEQAQARFARGWRPDGMCSECPKLEQPCRACFAKAGYPDDHYDVRWPPPAVQPLVVEGLAPPEPVVGIVLEGLAVSDPAPVGVVEVDMDAPPAAHDGDEPEPIVVKPGEVAHGVATGDGTGERLPEVDPSAYGEDSQPLDEPEVPASEPSTLPEGQKVPSKRKKR